jgi:hypothetical protein
MKSRLASVFLLLVLAGSTFAGMPLHFGESECGMDSMIGYGLLQSRACAAVKSRGCGRKTLLRT